MKAILEFELPEEREEFEVATNAGKLVAALCEIKNFLRTNRKYGPSNHKLGELSKINADLWQEIVEEIEAGICECMREVPDGII